MPARRAFKSHAKRPARTAPRRRDLSRTRARKPRLSRVRTSARAAPNVYNFTRGFDSYGDFGTDSGIFATNTDDKYLIISLATQFSDLPDYTEFNSLFSEYKINNFKVTLVPNFESNQYQTLTSTDTVARTDIRNYQCFAVPVNYTDQAQDFSTMSASDIDKYLNVTQRKRMSVFPGKTTTYTTSKPKVVKYIGAVGKELGISTSAMGNPYWLSTDAPPDPNPTGVPDERTVKHYGMRLLIRRVDGSAFTTTANPMGWRVQHQVNFACRKVQ